MMKWIFRMVQADSGLQTCRRLHAVRVDAAFAAGLLRKHTLSVTNAGSLADPVTPAALHRDKLHDLVVLRYISPYDRL